MDLDNLPIKVRARLQQQTFAMMDPLSEDGRLPFPSNEQKSTKYTFWNFLPVALAL